ncbi:MAG: hypothetical protein WCF94_01540 [bacterium]
MKKKSGMKVLSFEERDAILADAKHVIRERAKGLQTKVLRGEKLQLLLIAEEGNIYKILPLLNKQELEKTLFYMIHLGFIGKHLDLKVMTAKAAKLLKRDLTPKELRDIEIRIKYNEHSEEVIKLWAKVQKDKSLQPQYDAMSVKTENLSNQMSWPGVIF